ncbi:MAG: hypothetical protein QXY49_00410 [Thermofilaceae archaeon]
MKAVKVLREASAKHEERLTRIEGDVRSIKSNLDKYLISLEEEANEVIGISSSREVTNYPRILQALTPSMS